MVDTLITGKVDKTNIHTFTVNHESKDNLKCIDGQIAQIEIKFKNGLFDSVNHNILEFKTRSDWIIANAISSKITELEKEYKNNSDRYVYKPLKKPTGINTMSKKHHKDMETRRFNEKPERYERPEDMPIPNKTPPKKFDKSQDEA